MNATLENNAFVKWALGSKRQRYVDGPAAIFGLDDPPDTSAELMLRSEVRKAFRAGYEAQDDYITKLNIRVKDLSEMLTRQQNVTIVIQHVSWLPKLFKPETYGFRRTQEKSIGKV